MLTFRKTTLHSFVAFPARLSFEFCFPSPVLSSNSIRFSTLIHQFQASLTLRKTTLRSLDASPARHWFEFCFLRQFCLRIDFISALLNITFYLAFTMFPALCLGKSGRKTPISVIEKRVKLFKDGRFDLLILQACESLEKI